MLDSLFIYFDLQMIALTIQTATAREDVLIRKQQAILVISASANLGTSANIVKKVCYVFVFYT